MGDGKYIKPGVDLIIGLDDDSVLSPELVMHLSDQGFSMSSHDRNMGDLSNSYSYWFDAFDLS